jgi:putative inorganic carbon (HCO3(-)) transporter
MTTRLQRFAPGSLGLLLIVVGGAAGAVAAPRAHGLDPFTGMAIGMVVAILGATALTLLEPAWIITGALVISVFSGNWGNLGIPFPLDRVALVCGIGSTVVHALRERRRIDVRTVHWLMCLLILFAIASAAWSGTLTQHGPLFALLDRLGVFPFVLYLLAPVAFRESHQRQVLTLGLLVLGAYLGLITLFEAIGLRGLVIPHYILNPALGIHSERARGPFLEAGANGLAMYVCAVAAAMTIPSWRDRRMKMVAVGVIVLCAGGILYTLTRQTWIGAIGGTLAAILVDRRLRVHLPVIAIGGLIVVLVSLALIPKLSQDVNTRSGAQGPVWDRLNSDAAALRMIEARPALGFGWGTFQNASVPYYRLAATYPLTSVGQAHNVPLSNAAELGLVGTLLWLVILCLALVLPASRRAPPEFASWRSGLVAVAVAWFIQANFTPLDYAFDNYVVWLFAGILVSGNLQAGGSLRTPPVGRMPRVPTGPQQTHETQLAG